jgi:hypothetical protein
MKSPLETAARAAIAALSQHATFPADVSAAKKWLADGLSTADPREALIDELAAALWTARQFIATHAPDSEPTYTTLRNIASSCARATAHQEARRHAQ